MLRLRKQELKALKASYHDLAIRHKLKTGWELDQENAAPALASLAPDSQKQDKQKSRPGGRLLRFQLLTG